MMRTICAALCLVLIGGAQHAHAQSEQPEPTATIRSLDSRFWEAYNSCDTGALDRFFTADVEFYHDKGGVTLGAKALIASLKNGLCGGATRLRREALDDTVRLSLLRNGREIYGAVLAGEHRFYIVEAGKAERLDGQAKFVHLWLLQDGHWRMSRILSYDHGPVPYVSARTAITLSESVLESYSGSYQSQGGKMYIQRAGGGLVLSGEGGKGPSFTLRPESDSDFFVADRDLTFEFVKGDNGRVTAMRVREKGEIVEEAKRDQE